MNQISSQILPADNLVGQEQNDLIDLRKYWVVVWREKWGISGLVVVCSLIALIVVQNLTPIYRATATLLIEANEANVVSIEEVYGIDSSNREYFATQFEILNSRQLARQVIDELVLASHPEFDPRQQQSIAWRRYVPFLPRLKPVSDAQVKQQVVDRFQSKLSVQPIRNTQLVKISFESADPTLTFRVANALGETYVENHLESRLALTQRAASWLTERLGGMREDLEGAEKNLQSYRERENLVDVSGVGTLTAKEIDELTQQLVSARNRASEFKSQNDAVGNVNAGYSGRWETLPGVLRNSLTQRLKESETVAAQELSELSQRYGVKHPKRIAAKSKLDEAEQVYRRQVIKVISGFGKAYEQAVADRQALERSLDRAKGEIQSINRKRYELSQLEREVQTNRQLYDLFFTRFKETNTTSFEAANARFVDQAVQPFSPIKPRKSIILLLVALLACVVGVLLAFLKDILDNTVKSAHEVEAKLEQPVIGVLPRVEVPQDGKIAMSEAVLDGSQRAFAEAVRTVRTSVALSGIDKPLKRLVVTSSVPGEGKTTMAMNLAFAFGQLEKVLLVDADMRRPSVAENCGLQHRTPGLSNVIAGTESLEKCLHSYRGIDILSAGVVPPNPLELLSSTRFNELLQSLAQQYERVVIDSAPTQAVSDSLILSSHVDGVIYVVKSDATTTQVAQNGLQRLQRVNAHILGVTLNQFDPRQALQYGSYGKDYYDYYGYGSRKSYE